MPQRPISIALLAAATLALAASVAAPLAAQIRTVDPSSPAVSSDLAPPPSAGEMPADAPPTAPAPYTAPPPAAQREPTAPPPGASRAPPAETYKRDDIFSAAEGVFGKGAEGLAKIVQKILADQGEPTAYIAGREAGGAFAVGLRYGSGVLHHKIEGDRTVYWTGPSLGFDVGGNAAKEFVLVYNLEDSEELFKRFPAAEGAAYAIGGFTASYLRRGDIVLIPIRLGVGWRLGANVGYMKFTKKSDWVPF